MAAPRRDRHGGLMNKRVAIPLALLVAFTAWSLWLVAGDSYLGFLRVAWREPWAAQMLTDLVVACFLVSSWMIRDARERRLPVAPYLIATIFLGSIGPLAYLVHRGVRRT
jgi:hypothetical protein